VYCSVSSTSIPEALFRPVASGWGFPTLCAFGMLISLGFLQHTRADSGLGSNALEVQLCMEWVLLERKGDLGHIKAQDSRHEASFGDAAWPKSPMMHPSRQGGTETAV